MVNLTLLLYATIIICFYLPNGVSTRLQLGESCWYDSGQSLQGHVSDTEQEFHRILSNITFLNDTSREIIKANTYLALKNKEISVEELIGAIKTWYINPLQDFDINGLLMNENYDWKSAYRNKVFAWTIDLHPSPAACNQAIYRDIDVVLHAEVDHHPYCEYYGVCSTDRLKVFSLLRGEGFSLDPDHSTLKRNFFEHYRNSSEFSRIDVFMCSHPAANCEMFERFIEVQNKSIIIFFTTRLEFGRDDMNVAWRRRVAARWHAQAEKNQRYKEWLMFIWKYHNAGKLFLTANNKYDQEYVRYMTGIEPTYIPSWCGDFDGSYGLRHNWQGCVLSEDGPHYRPTRQEIVFVPYKQPLWTDRSGNIQDKHAIYQDLNAAIRTSVYALSNGKCSPSLVKGLHVANCTFLRAPIHFSHGQSSLTNHLPSNYRTFPAVVFLSYQTSVMSFFEFYRMNIPMFTPSLQFLVELEMSHNIVDGRIYGWPLRYLDLIDRHTGTHFNDSYPPSPNVNRDSPDYLASISYWLEKSDVYHFPHVVLFDNWTHLVHLTQTVNLTDISEKMYLFNRKQRRDIMQSWDQVFRKATPHIIRNPRNQ